MCFNAFAGAAAAAAGAGLLFFRASNVSLSISHIPSIFSSEGEMKVVLFGAVHYSQEKKTRAYVGIDEKIKDCLPRSYLIYH